MRKICCVVFLLCTAAVFSAENLTREEVLEYEGWKEIYDEFSADMALVESLKMSIGDGLKIDVYFAFWCIDSVNNIPPFIKIIDSIDCGNIQVHYFKVERKESREQKYYVDDLQVEKIPTFIFYRGGLEIGRVIENPQNSLAEDFLKIIL